MLYPQTPLASPTIRYDRYVSSAGIIAPMLSELKLPGWLKFGLILPIIFIDGWLSILLFQFFQPITSVDHRLAAKA